MALFRKKSLKHQATDADSDDPPVARGDYGIVSYSQEGEDLVLRRLLKNEGSGFYVDIGAHHPERFSNTYYYYKQGWTGLNVDADPDLMAEFNEFRPRDINVACGVGKKGNDLIFYVFNERAINTFDQKLANERAKVDGWQIVEERPIEVKTLDSVLDHHLPKKQPIDFMSVDVEGKDLEVLQSNNWTKYRPDFLLVEAYNVTSLTEIAKDKISIFLKKQKYLPVAKTYYTIIFANMDVYGKK